MARKESMDKIDQYLSGATRKDVATEDTEHFDSTLEVVPGVQAPAPVSDSVSGENEQEEAGQEESEEETKESQKALEKALREREQREQEEKDAFVKSANATVAAMKSIVRGTNVGLSRLPLPGGLLFPFVILLVFFLLLIQVNGHTRFSWLWLTLSGNASIEPGTPPTGTPVASTPPPPILTPPIIAQPPAILPLVTFTGVSDD